MKIKVCGMRQAENIRQVAALGVDYVGLIFYPRSPRYVDMVPTHAGFLPDQAGDLYDRAGAEGSAVDGRPALVGVFVDEMVQQIITRVVQFGLDVVQLHGHETPTLIRNLRRSLAPDLRPGIQLWKAVSVSTEADLDVCRQYEDCVDAFLFDTKCSTMGGSGRQFDWQVLSAYQGPRPFMLSGGLGPDDAPRLRHYDHPRCMGVDLNSRFEREPALKDVQLLARFVQQLQPSSPFFPR